MEQFSKKEIEMLKLVATEAIPYAEDDPAINRYDGDVDSDRLAALHARLLLDKLGIPLVAENSTAEQN